MKDFEAIYVDSEDELGSSIKMVTRKQLEIGTGLRGLCWSSKVLLCGVLACDLLNQHTLHRFGAAGAGCICCGSGAERDGRSRGVASFVGLWDGNC